jgi:O-antigen/teichoic acid export membrane protein
MIMSVYFSNLSNFCSGIFSAYKDTKILAKTTVVATIINFVVGFLLIQKIGLYASILATLTAYIVIYFYRNSKLKKYIVLKHDNYVIYHTIVLLLVVFCYYTKNILFILIGCLISLAYSFFANKELIMPIIKKIKRK